MSAVVFYFHVHQPFRVKPYSVFNAGKDHYYFNHPGESDLNNRRVLRKVADKCYLPATELLLELITQYPQLKLSFSISGVALEQFTEFAPEVIDAFKALATTGKVEFLTETYYHSLSFLHSLDEFHSQVKLHSQTIHQLFNYQPTAFRNTELIYNNAIAQEVEHLGYEVILAEGIDHILGWRSPNFVYQPINCSRIKLLLKNYRLSDDIAFRFSDRNWSQWPLTAEKFATWLSAVNGTGHLINLFMDFETLGEHQWINTGIFDFLKHLPGEILKHPDNTFMTVTESSRSFPIMDKIDMHNLTSWADTERDLSAWLSNPMQYQAMQAIYDLKDQILATSDQQLISDWRRLQTSDHFYYMCTKWWADGDVHTYFSPYDSPYEAFVNYMNVIQDLRLRTENHSKNTPPRKKMKSH